MSSNGPLIEKALKRKLVIPDFEHFKERIDELYHECLPITDGEVSIAALTNSQYDEVQLKWRKCAKKGWLCWYGWVWVGGGLKYIATSGNYGKVWQPSGKW